MDAYLIIIQKSCAQQVLKFFNKIIKKNTLHLKKNSPCYICEHKATAS